MATPLAGGRLGVVAPGVVRTIAETSSALTRWYPCIGDRRTVADVDRG